MDSGTWGYQRDDIRVSDADRDQAVAELSEHFQTGRLTQDEFDDRSGQALRARTGSDLGALFTDLPPRSVATVTAPPETEPFGPGVPRPHGHRMSTSRFVIACVIVAIVAGNVFGNAVNLGWLVPVVILGFVFLRIGGHHHRR